MLRNRAQLPSSSHLRDLHYIYYKTSILSDTTEIQYSSPIHLFFDLTITTWKQLRARPQYCTFLLPIREEGSKWEPSSKLIIILVITIYSIAGLWALSSGLQPGMVLLFLPQKYLTFRQLSKSERITLKNKEFLSPIFFFVELLKDGTCNQLFLVTSSTLQKRLAPMRLRNGTGREIYSLNKYFIISETLI